MRSRLDQGEFIKFDFDDFDWDEDKAKSNFQKHGVDFYTAAMLFEQDVYAVGGFEGAEWRWLAVGQTHGQEFTIAFIDAGSVCRVISVRSATRTERRSYYQNLTQRGA